MIAMTSRAARQQIEPDVPRLRARVLAALAERPATDEELQERLELAGNTERPRRAELCLLGQVRDSGRRRYTRSRRLAIVWELVPRREQLELDL